MTANTNNFPKLVKDFGSAEHVIDMPNLIDIVTNSYESFLQSDLRELFDEISPIADFTGNLM